MSTKTGLSATKCGARCLIDRIRLGEMAFANSPSLLLRASGTSIAPRDSQSSLPFVALAFSGAVGLTRSNNE
jgi:hypothetical protein